MVLLTSSQVSVAISSAIVVSFTSALFLSGYVLQQATLRDLRAAIKPQMVRPLPELQINLQPQYQNDDLEQRSITDATSVEVQTSRDNQDKESAADEVQIENKSMTPNVNEDSLGDREDDMIGATRWQKEKKRKERLLSEQQKQTRLMNNDEGQKETPVHQVVDKTRDKEPKFEEKPMSRAERRKKIKDEILADGEGEDVQGYRRRMW